MRVVSVVASWEGPVVDTRDLRVDALYGDRFLRDIQPGSNVRVSIGWRDGGFEPFAVGSEVTAPRAVPVESVAQEVARWEASPWWRLSRAGASTLRRRRTAGGRAVHARRATAPLRDAQAAALGGRAWAHLARGTPGPVDTGVGDWDALPGEGAPRDELEAAAPYEEAA